MADQLEPFRRLTQAFDPMFKDRRDPHAGLGAYYIPEAHQEFRAQLTASLSLNSNVKLLIAGQPGCGKTTLLLDFAQEFRRQGRLVAFINMELSTTVQDLGPVEMHMAVLSEVLREVQRSKLLIAPAALRPCQGWVDKLSRDGSAAPEPGALGSRLSALLAALRDSPALRQELRALVQAGEGSDPARVLFDLLTELAAYEPLVILDGLDKVGPEQARALFLDDKKPMADAPGAAILTIPLSVVYEPSFNVLSERYLNAGNAVLPAVRIYSVDEKTRRFKRSEEGFALLRRIVNARVQPLSTDVLTEDAVDRAIDSSGGNLRELGRLMQATVVKTVLRRGTLVEPQDVELAIADQRESFRRAYQPRFLPFLKKVRDELQLDNVDDIGKLLLYGLWVVEYRNGITWYKLPVPVEQLVKQLDRPPQGPA